MYAEKVAKDRARCRLCGRVVSVKDGTTSNLKEHMVKHHFDNEEVVESFAVRDAYIKEMKNEQEYALENMV